MAGKVYIVGAGPGSADLLTVRAASIIRSADVVLHDDLVSREVIDLAPRSAEVINVGKRCGRHGSSQQQINALMVEHARRGLTVVRLKSGDPAVFGRLGEELDCLREADISVDIVPGVTAATAAAAAAMVTLTDRRWASTLVIMTGHRCDNQAMRRVTFDPQETTYAIYMPGPDYGKTARELMQSGLEADTPCALVSRAGSREQQVHSLRLSELQDKHAIAAPAILIIGEVTRDSSADVQSEILQVSNAVIREQVWNSPHPAQIL
jgi:uroporphyrin-III C-methyltransferase / precorrin-2 dehydrogenase / sirohydrochlorin ferrochelatase